MSTERSTASPPSGPFILPLTAEDHAIGGKARSLARLAELGLPVPSGFAVGDGLLRALRAGGPPLPERLTTAGDLAALDAARDALTTAPFPTGFAEALAAALDAAPGATPGTTPDSGTFSVRSSGATEDRASALAAGVFASELRVPAAAVADAVRRVLASFLTPAAWTYAARSSPGSARAQPNDATRLAAVLVHPFVDGTSAGAAACAPAAPPLADPTAAPLVRIDAHLGAPTARARDRIEAAARTAAAHFGSIEIEWVADGDEVTYLQLRAHHPTPESAPRPLAGSAEAWAAFAMLLAPAPEGKGWSWDAAHNPRPLSPAQAGLVALVDERCRIGIRQQVVQGYLFFKRTTPPSTPPQVVDPRAALDRLRAQVEPRLAAAGPAPALSAALDLYVAGYQPLFGDIGPASTAARQALADFVTGRLGDPAPDLAAVLGALLAGVPSVATRRRAAAARIAAATDGPARQAAIDAYLAAFGDESPRWDVAAPTLRERPEPLLLFGATASAASPDGEGRTQAARADESAADIKRRLPATDHARFDGLLAAARAACAVGEDDDALFARLQAVVRRALLELGRRLAAAGTLDAVDDVFYLPLSLARALDQPPADSDEASAPPVLRDESNPRRIAAAGLAAFRAAELAPPPPPVTWASGPIVIRGRAGAGGRTVGRAVHHPAATPLGGDAVLIAATLLPTELPLLSPAAVVTETGEVLGHVAAQARERGIPAVVGAAGARAAIPEGALVVVDGDRGEVVRLDEPHAAP